MRYWLLLLCMLANVALASKQVVNFYTWADYVPNSVIRQFERETGISVVVNEFSNNDVMYTKLKTNPRVGYDVVLLSSDYLQRMVNEAMLHRLDRRHLPNLRYLYRERLNAPFDRHNQYSVPFFWGTTGILVNDRYWRPESITRWQDLWQTRFHHQLLLFDDSIETFAIGLKALGYSLNDRNPQHIQQAFQRLKKLLPNVRLFNTDAVINIYIDEDATIGMAWNGDAALAQKENPHLHFIFPQDGFTIWVDYFAIPIHAPHPSNAQRFINFLSRPDIARQIAEQHLYSTANWKAMQQMPASYRDNPTINPSAEVLKRGEMQQYLGQANVLYQKYWQLLKLSAGG